MESAEQRDRMFASIAAVDCDPDRIRARLDELAREIERSREVACRAEAEIERAEFEQGFLAWWLKERLAGTVPELRRRGEMTYEVQLLAGRRLWVGQPSRSSDRAGHRIAVLDQLVERDGAVPRTELSELLQAERGMTRRAVDVLLHRMVRECLVQLIRDHGSAPTVVLPNFDDELRTTPRGSQSRTRNNQN